MPAVNVNKYWSAQHVPSMEALPKNLVKGRAYFVDDEHVIIVNHGDGAVLYGGKAGPQGIPGEPQPAIQYQLDKLAEASITNSATFFEFVERVKALLAQTNESVNNSELRLQGQIDEMAENAQNAHTDLQGQIDEMAENAQTTHTAIFGLLAQADQTQADAQSQLQHQLDQLAKASVTSSATFFEFVEKVKALITQAHTSAQNTESKLQYQIDQLAEGLTRLSAAIMTLAEIVAAK